MKKILVVIFWLTASAAMSQNLKISQLPVATTPLSGTELMVVVQNSVTKQTTVNEIGTTVPGYNLITGNPGVSGNLFFGTVAGNPILSGTNNLGFGNNVVPALTTGSNNVVIGNATLVTNTTGSSNLGIGNGVLPANLSGSLNTALGAASLATNIIGSNLTAVGSQTDVATDGLSNSIALGSGAVITASNQLVIGSASMPVSNWVVNNVPYVMPSAQGAAATVLTNDGSGNLSWAPASGSGTVTSFSSGNLAPLFTTSVTSSTSTPALSYSLSNAAAHTFFGNFTGSGAAPSFSSPTLASADFTNQGTTTTVLHGNASGNPSWAAVGLTTDVTGTLAIANGGTGQTTASAAINALLPSQSGNSGKYLTTNGTSASWATVSGGGGSPGGSNTDIQYNSSGSFAGDNNFTRSSWGMSITNGPTLGDIFIGASATSGNSTTTPANNIGIGDGTLTNIVGFSPVSGHENVAIGTGSMNSTVDGWQNTALGYEALQTNTSGSRLIAIGPYADVDNIGTYTNSVAIGAEATISASNQFILNSAIVNWNIGGVPYVLPTSQGSSSTVLTNDGSGNLSWGSSAAQWHTYDVSLYNIYNLDLFPSSAPTGAGNTLLEGYVPGGINLNSGSLNTLVGTFTGTQLTTESSNTFIGGYAGQNDVGDNGIIILGNTSSANGLYNSIVLGNNATATNNNQLLIAPSITDLNIGNVDYPNVPNTQGVQGSLLGNDGSGDLSWQPTTAATAAGEVLTNDGSGNLSWQPQSGSVVNAVDLTGLNTGITTITTYTNPDGSNSHTYEIGGYITIIGSPNSTHFTVSYIDENGNSQSYDLAIQPYGSTSFSLVSSSGGSVVVSDIRVGAGQSITITSASSSTDHDIGASIKFIN